MTAQFRIVVNEDVSVLDVAKDEPTQLSDGLGVRYERGDSWIIPGFSV